MRARVADVYGIDAEVVPPAGGHRRARALAGRPPGVEPGFLLCVSRLLPYKNVGAVVEAFARRPDQRLVVVGTGPLAEELAPPHRPT